MLPSTVTSIAYNGIYWNNLIKTIYYCGSTHLSNHSALENVVSSPDIKVTRSYTYAKIFRDYTPKNDSISIVEAEEIRDKYKPDASPSPHPSPSHSPLPSPSPTASSQPTAGFPGRRRPNSLLSWIMGGWWRIGSLRRGELQTAESDPAKPEQ